MPKPVIIKSPPSKSADDLQMRAMKVSNDFAKIIYGKTINSCYGQSQNLKKQNDQLEVEIKLDDALYRAVVKNEMKSLSQHEVKRVQGLKSMLNHANSKPEWYKCRFTEL